MGAHTTDAGHRGGLLRDSPCSSDGAAESSTDHLTVVQGRAVVLDGEAGPHEAHRRALQPPQTPTWPRPSRSWDGERSRPPASGRVMLLDELLLLLPAPVHSRQVRHCFRPLRRCDAPPSALGLSSLRLAAHVTHLDHTSCHGRAAASLLNSGHKPRAGAPSRADGHRLRAGRRLGRWHGAACCGQVSSEPQRGGSPMTVEAPIS
jgi:hypothetical protein